MQNMNRKKNCEFYHDYYANIKTDINEQYTERNDVLTGLTAV